MEFLTYLINYLILESVYFVESNLSGFCICPKSCQLNDLCRVLVEVIKGDCRHRSPDLGGHGLAEVTNKVSHIEYLGGLSQVGLVLDLKMPVVGEVQLETSMVSYKINKASRNQH